MEKRCKKVGILVSSDSGGENVEMRALERILNMRKQRTYSYEVEEFEDEVDSKNNKYSREVDDHYGKEEFEDFGNEDEEKKEKEETKKEKVVTTSEEETNEDYPVIGKNLIWDKIDLDEIKKEYDLLIVKNTWDYEKQWGKFQKFLEKIVELKIPLFNDIEIIKWNAVKHLYLKELEKEGVSIVPTESLSCEEFLQLDENSEVWKGYFEKFKKFGEKIVIKPSIGAGGKFTEIFQIGEIKKAKKMVKKISSYSEYILFQPFLTALQKNGEISLMFIMNKYSGSVMKMAKEKEWKVQTCYGGRSFQFLLGDAEKRILKFSEKIINEGLKLSRTKSKVIHHCRIDFVWDVEIDKFYLMEFECIEPSLYAFVDETSTITYKREIIKFLIETYDKK